MAKKNKGQKFEKVNKRKTKDTPITEIWDEDNQGEVL